MGQISGTVATGIASLPRAAAHELGHNFGLLHAPCGVLDGLDTNYPPSLGGRIGFVGFNVHTGEPIPASYYDMMSYCGERAWISAYNTERLFNVLSAVRARQASLAQTEQPAWLVNGAIAPDGLSGTLSFAEPISSTATIAEGGTGPHRIELWRGAELVFSHRFEAQVPAAHETDGLNASFTLVIPRPADITELRLLAGDTLLDGIAVDAAAPTVTAELAPFGVGTTPRSVQWGISPAATEPDIVSVRYSADGGQRWEVLGQINDPAITSLSFDLADLPESADGLIEVVATRGATSGSAQVSVGPVANKPPVVQIVQGEKLQVTTSEPLVLQGSAYDREDGVIADDRYSWRDASGQLLGSGPLLELPALDTLAQRMITLTVTDSDGAAAQATVYITAGERTYLPFARR